MKLRIFLILSLIPISVSAIEVVPATSESTEDFERLVSESSLRGGGGSRRKDAVTRSTGGKSKTELSANASKDRKQTFGVTVSNEAKDLVVSGQKKDADFGSRVSNQKRKDGASKVGGGMTPGSDTTMDASDSSSAQTKVPRPDSSASPGRNKK